MYQICIIPDSLFLLRLNACQNSLALEAVRFAQGHPGSVGCFTERRRKYSIGAVFDLDSVCLKGGQVSDKGVLRRNCCKKYCRFSLYLV